ncbi:arf-GAP domain and FG repeat-containing protein 1a isoform X4 [Alosa alosa]|uniref:arf-GAP domain and FG repeat-containing protein 1a isoform X4 n=1 Tax=Alosa alosa TaxID=278164 RepID=UPI0020150711|nr:arf-GAP domain and FG repeat-containing protein 1a isoform X4 [Alosa alosa]
MAASAKRKQEEKHLKMLREMTSLPPNRKCFDCDQRGPTYANMTVGSFVCTSCSGILRGLNPPHRVKSISMTTFAQQEIEFLQKHGNEVCKPIWLGLYDDRTSSVPDFREPQKVKEFLQEKYEKKRWYVPPEQARVVASVHASISGSSASSTSSTPEVRPLKTLLGESAPTLHLNKNTPSQSPVVARSQQMSHQEKKFDLLSDLGGDIFAAPPSQAPSSSSANFANFAHFNSHPGGSSGLANASFANFDNFPKSCSADFGALGQRGTSAGADAGRVDGASSVPADRYAALADLDGIFNMAQSESGGAVPTGVSSAPPSAGVGPPPGPVGSMGGDRYAALAELDNVFSSSAPPTSVYNTISTAQETMFGAVTSVSSAQMQQGLPSMPQCFGGPSTNPFVASSVAPAVAPTNPFQTNGRAAAVAAAASFGTGSMSMPAGFGNAAAYNMPTSFSGTFQQAFPGQAFPPTQAFPPQPNGASFSAFGQPKPVPAFGQPMAAPGVSSNPFLMGAPAQFPTGNSSTNPFL